MFKHWWAPGISWRHTFSPLNSPSWFYLIPNITKWYSLLDLYLPAWPSPLNSSSSIQLHITHLHSNLPCSDWNRVSCACLCVLHLNKWQFCFSSCSSQKPRRHLCFLTFPHTWHLTSPVGATKLYLQSDHFNPPTLRPPNPSHVIFSWTIIVNFQQLFCFHACLFFFCSLPFLQPVQWSLQKVNQIIAPHPMLPLTFRIWSKIFPMTFWARHRLTPACFSSAVFSCSLCSSPLLGLPSLCSLNTASLFLPASESLPSLFPLPGKTFPVLFRWFTSLLHKCHILRKPLQSVIFPL